MRKIIIMIAITSTFAACKSKTETNKDIVGIDSASLYKNNIMADTAKLEALPAGITKRVVETRDANGNVITTTTTTTTSPTKSASSTKRSSTVATNAPSTTQATRKKGWSNRAKGTVIGGVGGAVVGAAVSKKKGKGALIGGAVGAAGGYIIGNEKDKKEGR
jgi:uncharacterized protein YcfJ